MQVCIGFAKKDVLARTMLSPYGAKGCQAPKHPCLPVPLIIRAAPPHCIANHVPLRTGYTPPPIWGGCSLAGKSPFHRPTRLGLGLRFPSVLPPRGPAFGPSRFLPRRSLEPRRVRSLHAFVPGGANRAPKGCICLGWLVARPGGLFAAGD